MEANSTSLPVSTAGRGGVTVFGVSKLLCVSLGMLAAEVDNVGGAVDICDVGDESEGEAVAGSDCEERRMLSASGVANA